MDRDQNLLFGVLAVQLKKVAPSQLVDAAATWATDPSRDLGELLAQSGALPEKDRKLIAGLVDEAVRIHDGDTSAALASFGGEDQVRLSFQGTIVRTESGGVATVLASEASIEFLSRDSVTGVQESPGRYTYLNEYGRGGMGRVLLVYDEHLARDVALKELLPELDPGTATGQPSPVRLSASIMSRFLQEARITGQLEHPSIVPVYELGHRRDGTVYYTMKLVRGKTLDRAIRESGSLHERLGLLPHFVDLCQAIAYAHHRGVIHRDIKPSNVMVGEFGETVVLDWGLAKAKNKEDAHAAGLAEIIRAMNVGDVASGAKTTYGQVLGTPVYMPPEQARGEIDKVDERSDVYSLGAVLYELLTGKLPFEIPSEGRAIRTVLDGEPAPIPTIEPEAPPELVAICQRAMQKDPSDRYDSARELATEVQRFQSGALVKAYAYKFSELLKRFAVRHKAILITASIALIVLAASSVFYVLSLVQSRNREMAMRIEAVVARDREREARQDEERARKLAEREVYRSRLLLAGHQIESSQYGVANQTLWRTSEDLRNWEWGYLLRLCNQEQLILDGHSDDVLSAEFSPDGTRILTASKDKTAKLWDAETGIELRSLEGHTEPVYSARFSPDGTRVLTRAFRRHKIWDAQTGADLFTLKGHADLVHGSEFSPDGKRILTWSRDETAKIWDVEGGAQIASLEGHSGEVLSAAFSPDGTKVVTGSSDSTAKVWDVAAGSELVTLEAHSEAIRSVDFNAAGDRLVTLSDDATAKVWDARTWTELTTLETQSDRAYLAAFSPNGKDLLTMSADTTDAEDLWTLRTDVMARVWDVETGGGLFAFKGPFTTATFSPDGALILTACSDKTVNIWDARTGDELITLRGHAAAVNSPNFAQDGARFVTASKDHTARVWSTRALEEIHALKGHSGWVYDASFSPDGEQVVTASYDGSVRIWDLDSGNDVLTLAVPGYRMRSAAFSPDGALLVTTSHDATGLVWNVAKREIVTRLIGHRGQLTTAAFSPDGQHILTACYDRTAKVWDAISGAELVTLQGHSDRVRSALYSQDGRRVVTASEDNTARIWNPETGAELLVLSGHEDAVWHASFTADGKRIVTTSADRTARIWDAATGSEISRFAGHSGTVNAAAIVSDGTRVVTVSEDDRAVKLSDIETGDELATLRGHEQGARAVSATPDGRRIVTASLDCTARLWDAAPWRIEDLPGDESMTWRERFEVSKRTAPDTGPNPGPSSGTPHHVVVLTREEVNRRLGNLLEVLSEEERSARPGDQDVGAGLEVLEGPRLRPLTALGLENSDTAIGFNDMEITGRANAIDAIDGFLQDAQKGLALPLNISVIRNGKKRVMEFDFVERTPVEKGLAISCASAIGLLNTCLKSLDMFKIEIAEYERFASARAGFVNEGQQLHGLFVGSLIAETPEMKYMEEVVYNLYSQVGLVERDHITAINGAQLDSFDTVRQILKGALDQAKKKEPFDFVLDVLRGRFQRVKITLTVE